MRNLDFLISLVYWTRGFDVYSSGDRIKKIYKPVFDMPLCREMPCFFSGVSDRLFLTLFFVA